MRLTLQDHLEPIKQWLAEGYSYRQIADQLGCNKETVNVFVKVNLPAMRRASSHDLQRKPVPPKPKPETPDELELALAELREVKAHARRHRTIDVQAEALLREVRSVAVPKEPIYEPPEDAEGGGKPHVHLLLLSDLHIGEVVNSEAVNGLNEYSLEIAKERLAGISKALRSFQNARPYPIDELIVGWLGDMNGGANHLELAVTNELSEAEQCFITGQLLAEHLEPHIEDYPRIRVVGVAGNHPRVPAKPASKQVFNNFDWLSYKYAEILLSKYPTVEFALPMSGYHVADVAGRNMLFFHGDGIRSTMPGVPWGGVMRRIAELKKSYVEQGVLLDYFALGHFHQANVVQASVFMNGSVKGLDEYSLKQFGAGEKPTQLLLTFCKATRRLTDVSFITP